MSSPFDLPPDPLPGDDLPESLLVAPGDALKPSDLPQRQRDRTTEAETANIATAPHHHPARGGGSGNRLTGRFLRHARDFQNTHER